MLILNVEKGQIVDFDPSARHREYVDMYDTWSKCRKAVSGARAVCEAGTEFLPPLSGHYKDKKLKSIDLDKYNEFKKRASWYGATGLTHNAFNGMHY